MNEKQITQGTPVFVKTHTVYQNLKVNAVIDPPIEHRYGGFSSVVVDVYQEEFEDEDGNPVNEYHAVLADGQIVPFEHLVALHKRQS